jgi:hypothetical protein
MLFASSSNEEAMEQNPLLWNTLNKFYNYRHPKFQSKKLSLVFGNKAVYEHPLRPLQETQRGN